MTDKNKSAPLPSMLSSIRNAGRSATLDGRINTNRGIELQPLFTENEENQSASHTSSPTYGGRNIKKIIERFGLGSISALGNARLRLRKRRLKPRKFSVKLPNRFILYFTVIFFVVPLSLGLTLLVKILLFGSQKEDPEHPLHRKHFTRNNVINSTVDSASTPSIIDNAFVNPVVAEKDSVHETEIYVGKADNLSNQTEPIESTLKNEKDYVSGSKKTKETPHKGENDDLGKKEDS